MYTIDKKYENEIEVERSSFISLLFPINSEEDAKNILLSLRKEHPKARHICYAYCLKGAYKSSDDGEPKGTAGRPLQELLDVRKLNNTLLVVIRYFGGVLLGAGRLLRTYVDAGNKVIEKAELLEEVECLVYKVVANPSQYDLLMSFCNKNDIITQNVEFNELITLDLISKSDIINSVNEFFNGKIEIDFVCKKVLQIRK